MKAKLKKPKLHLKKAKVISCPEGCRKKFTCVGGLNTHLGRNHNVNYKLHVDKKNYAWFVPNGFRATI